MLSGDISKSCRKEGGLLRVEDVWGHRRHTLEWPRAPHSLEDMQPGGERVTGWGGTRLKQRVSGDPRRGLTLLEYQGKEPAPQFLPTGSPRTWWAVGRAKRNLLVLWFTVWRMDDKRLTRQVWCRQLPGASQPQPSGTPVPSATPQLTVLSSSRSRYFSLGSRSVIDHSI